MSHSPKKTRDSENQYAILMETNGKEFESWYYFIKYDGNEENLKHLQTQFDDVQFFILDELSTFDLDLDHLVSERTAKEMTKVEVNSFMYNRKFDGVLEKINFKFHRKDSNRKKIIKVFETLGIGKIEDFIDKEDIDEEDLADPDDDVSESSGTEYEYNETSTDDSDYSSDEPTSSSSSESEDDRKKKKEKKNADRNLRDKILEIKKKKK